MTDGVPQIQHKTKTCIKHERTAEKQIQMTVPWTIAGGGGTEYSLSILFKFTTQLLEMLTTYINDFAK